MRPASSYRDARREAATDEISALPAPARYQPTPARDVPKGRRRRPDGRGLKVVFGRIEVVGAPAIDPPAPSALDGNLFANPLVGFHFAGLLARWNALIPKRALRVDTVPGGVQYLHPTKGWRFVSNTRLRLA